MAWSFCFAAALVSAGVLTGCSSSSSSFDPCSKTVFNLVPATAVCNASTTVLSAPSRAVCVMQCAKSQFCSSLSFITGVCVLSSSPLCAVSNASSVYRKDELAYHGYEQLIGSRRFWVFQQRKTVAVSFARNWTEYERGFGDGNDFWMGLRYLSLLTAQSSSLIMRAEMLDWNSTLYVAEYLGFVVQNARTNYTMNYNGLIWASSNVSSDSLSFSAQRQFSTTDRDNDKYSGSCSNVFGGAGWWFNYCSDSNPNGVMTSAPGTNSGPEVHWYGVHGDRQALKAIRLMIQLV